MLSALRELLVHTDPARVSIESIAAASGVHRSTIYRRWGDVAGVVADLADNIDEGLSVPTGASLEDDLRVLTNQLREHLSRDGGRLVAALLGWNTPHIQDILTRFWAHRIDQTHRVLQRWHIDADAKAVTRLLAGPLYYQTLMEHAHPSDNDAELVLATVLSFLDNEPLHHA